MRANQSILSVVSILSLSMLALSACGPKMNGTYSLAQMGGPFNSAQCSQINISVNENSNTVSGTGQNACYTEMLTGTDNGNGQMNATLTLMPLNNGTSGINTYSTMCSYQGTLMVSGNVVSGTLTPSTTMGYGCAGQIIINGTKN